MRDMDATEARTANMRRHVAAAGGAAEWARRYGSDRWSANQAQQWISATAPKPIGRRLARDLEVAMGLAPASLDRPPEPNAASGAVPSQPSGLHAPTFRRTLDFLEELFAAHGKDFVPTERVALIAAVYDEMRTSPDSNVVQLSVRFGRMLEEQDEREATAGSTVADDRRGTQQRARKAASAAGGKG